jgi:hypothetical protein
MSQEIFRYIFNQSGQISIRRHKLYRQTKEQTDLYDNLLRMQFVQETYLVSLKTYGALINDFNFVNFINFLSFA